MENKKRVLLTGIGGSIAVHFLAHIMHNTDWDVVGIDSFRHKGLTDRINVMFDSHPDWRERTTIVTHDLTAPFSPLTIKKIGHIDHIISMASLSDVEASIQSPVPFIRNNVELAINMLELAREIKPETFIQISTDEVYGASQSKTGDLRKEWDPIIPSNPYAASKACQEAIAISYWRTYGVPVIITNTMNNFGEMQSSAKYPVIVQKFVNEGKELTVHASETGEVGSRSYIHSRNFADAVIFILKNLPPYMHQAEKADKPDRYNIAGDIQLDNIELAQTIARLMEKELKYKTEDFHHTRPGHDPHYGLDMTKLKEAGWKQPLTFEESLKNVIEWQQENQEWIS
jgi:dTDP-glucose 4,6-dehydratase